MSTRQVQRLPAVDLLRGFTMLLMVFVNDLWSLKNVPEWMLHVAPDADGMGLSDVVFPAFLFITGLSLPLALAARTARGDDPLKLVTHIIVRGFALIVMGLFLVNGEYLNAGATGMSRHTWYVAACAAFILIWNSYPGLHDRKWVKLFRSAGIIILLGLAWIYRGGSEDAVYVFKPHWWGILGLIGWSYLAGGIITIAVRGGIMGILVSWLLFCAISMLHHADMLPKVLYLLPEPIIGGTMTALVLGGVLTMTIYLSKDIHWVKSRKTGALVFSLTVLILGYWLTRPVWGLSKQHATPAWLFICSAITLAGFGLSLLIPRNAAESSWLQPLRAAGANTLLTYLMPFFGYALLSVSPIGWPDWMLVSPVGLLKSAFFAVICAEVAAWLARRWIRLQL
jgi:heparan-alpha-glucosaminide N-acetyltransferase